MDKFSIFGNIWPMAVCSIFRKILLLVASFFLWGYALLKPEFWVIFSMFTHFPLCKKKIFLYRNALELMSHVCF